MPSIFTHAAAAVALGACFYPNIPKQALAVGAVCSAIPDLDVIGFSFGVHYGDFLGHRGFSHSLFFAAFLAGAATLFFVGDVHGRELLLLSAYLFIATASHGFLDALTDGGLGVAFFAPFSMRRYFFPWTPIRVAPIGLFRFFTARGLTVFVSELIWVWIPATWLATVALTLRRQRLHF